MSLAFVPPAEDLQIRTGETPQTSCIVLGGALDIAGLSALRAELQRAAATGAPVVVVDLAGLTLIESSAMRALLDFDEQLEHTGRQLRLLAGPPHVQAALRHCGLLDILHFAAR